MNELDKLYKENISMYSIPYRKEYWNTALDYIKQQERKRFIIKTGFLSLIVLLIASVGIISLYPPLDYFQLVPASSETLNTYAKKNAPPEWKQSEIPPSLQSTEISRGDSELNQEQNPPSNNYDVVISSMNNSSIDPDQTSVTEKAGSFRTKDGGGFDESIIENSTEFNLSQVGPISIFEDYRFDANFKSESLIIAPLSAIIFYPVNSLYASMNSMDHVVELGTGTFQVDTKLPGNRYVFSLGMPISLNTSMDRSRWLGLSAQVGKNIYLSEKWSIFTGIGYGYKNGPVGILHDHPTILYNFEKQKGGYALEVNQIHEIQLPVGVSYHLGKVTAGIGWQPNYVGFARGSLKKYTHDLDLSRDLPTVVINSKTLQTGNVNTEGIRKWTHLTYVHVGYQWSNNWSTSFRLSYNPSGYTDMYFGQQFDTHQQNYISKYKASRPYRAHAVNIELFVNYIL